MILGLDHVQITVGKSDVEKAREFYLEFLGLKEIEKPANRKSNGGFWASLGGAQLHVGLEDGVERARTKAHVAYRVSDLDEWKKKLSQSGIEYQDSPPFEDAIAFEFRDPFGNRVEIIQKF